MVTTERWTNGVLTSILLRVGSSGGGLPDALQVFGFAGRRYFQTLISVQKFFLSLSPIGFLYFVQIVRFRAALKLGYETFSEVAHLISGSRKHLGCRSKAFSMLG